MPDCPPSSDSPAAAGYGFGGVAQGQPPLRLEDHDVLAALDAGQPIDYHLFAAWLAQPGSRELLDARDLCLAELDRTRARNRRDYYDRKTDEAVQVLEDSIKQADELRKAEDATTRDKLHALTERRRAASGILRLASGSGASLRGSRRGSGPQRPAERDIAGGAPPSPPGRGPAAMRSIAKGVRAPSTPGSTAPPDPERHNTNPHSPNAHSESPSHRLTDSPSQLPPLLPHAEKKVAAFLRAAGQPAHMRRHSAEHWVQALGGEDEFLRYLEHLPLDFVHAQLHRATFNPEGDQAVVEVDYTQPDNSLLRGRVFACVESDADTFEPIRWAVYGLELDPPPPPPDDAIPDPTRPGSPPEPPDTS